MLGDVLGVLLMVLRGGVFVVFKDFFFGWFACQYQLSVKGMKRDTLLLGLYAGFIS